jgi:thiamine-phosphate pyrophosphorylase
MAVAISTGYSERIGAQGEPRPITYCCLVTALMSLDARLRLARLYLCTDSRQKQGDLADFLAAAFAGGVDIVQIRQKGMQQDEELAALELARRAAEPYQGIVCVNDSAELAGEFKADMLHLGQRDGSASAARKSLHRWAIIGRSTHEPRQADRAIRDRDVDYFCVGPVYATPTKPDAEPVGLDLVRYAARKAPVSEITSKPWFATGGISRDNIDEVIEAGARRVCVVRAITEAADPERAARELHTRLQAAWHADPAMQSYVFQAAAGAGQRR